MGGSTKGEREMADDEMVTPTELRDKINEAQAKYGEAGLVNAEVVASDDLLKEVAKLLDDAAKAARALARKKKD
jgi:hypothetical protein